MDLSRWSRIQDNIRRERDRRWETENLLQRVSEITDAPVGELSLETPIPDKDHVERIIDYLAWHNCSIDRSSMPKDRPPTIAEIKKIFSHSLGSGD